MGILSTIQGAKSMRIHKTAIIHVIFQIISVHLFHVGTLLEDVLDDVAGELVV